MTVRPTDQQMDMSGHREVTLPIIDICISTFEIEVINPFNMNVKQFEGFRVVELAVETSGRISGGKV